MMILRTAFRVLLAASVLAACSCSGLAQDVPVSPADVSRGEQTKLNSLYLEYVPRGVLGIDVRDEGAYVLTGEELRVYDITHASKPRQLVRYPLPVAAGDVKATGPYVVTVGGQMHEAVGYLIVLDVSNPETIRQVGKVDLPWGCVSVELKGNIAYVGGFDEGLFIVDLADKTKPRLVHNVRFPRFDNPKASLPIFSARRANTPESKLAHFPWKMGRTWWSHIEDDLLYVCDESTGLHILDISDPIAPKELSQFIHELWEGTNNLAVDAFNDIDIVGNVAYVAIDNGGMVVVDVSSKEAPSLAAHYDPWKDFIWRNSPGHMVKIMVKDGVAYLTAGKEGLYLLDVTDPRNPTVLAKHHSVRSGKGVGWGLFVNERYIFVGYMSIDPATNDKRCQGAWEIVERPTRTAK